MLHKVVAIGDIKKKKSFQEFQEQCRYCWHVSCWFWNTPARSYLLLYAQMWPFFKKWQPAATILFGTKWHCLPLTVIIVCACVCSVCSITHSSPPTALHMRSSETSWSVIPEGRTQLYTSRRKHKGSSSALGVWSLGLLNNNWKES